MRGDNLISRSWSTGFLLFIFKQDKVTRVAGFRIKETTKSWVRIF